MSRRSCRNYRGSSEIRGLKEDSSACKTGLERIFGYERMESKKIFIYKGAKII
jgi:hypothetical protein